MINGEHEYEQGEKKAQLEPLRRGGEKKSLNTTTSNSVERFKIKLLLWILHFLIKSIIGFNLLFSDEFYDLYEITPETTEIFRSRPVRSLTRELSLPLNSATRKIYKKSQRCWWWSSSTRLICFSHYFSHSSVVTDGPGWFSLKNRQVATHRKRKFLKINIVLKGNLIKKKNL